MPKSLRPLILAAACLLLAGQLLHGQEVRLSNKFVGGVDIDREDRIWIATEEGLNCYDGIRNRQFLKYGTALSSNQLNYVFCDRVDPYVWIATRKAGLCRYDIESGEFVNFRHNHSDLSTVMTDDITYIQQDGEGRIWVSTFSEGIDMLDKKSGTFKHFNASTLKGFRPELIQRFLVQDGSLCIGYWDAGLSIVDLATGTAQDFRHQPGDPSSLPSDGVRALFYDPGGNLWIGTTAGLALYSRSGGRFTVFRNDPRDPRSIPEGAVYDINMTPDWRLLVGIDGAGVVTLDIAGAYSNSDRAVFRPLHIEGHEEGLAVRSLTIDRFSNLWIGTFGEGVLPCRLSSTGINHLEYPYHLRARSASALVCSPQGELLVGNGSGQVDVLDKDLSRRALEGLSMSGSVQALYFDKAGKLWAGSSEDGIAIVSGGGVSRDRLGQEFLDVRTFLPDGDAVWAGTGSGLYKLSARNGAVLKRYTRREGLSDNLVRSLAKDRDGNLWVGSYGRGIDVLGPKMDTLAKHNLARGFVSNTINDILCDDGGRIWVATSEGLALFDHGWGSPSRIYTLRDGLANDHIRSLALDKRGNLWMSTHNGISCLTEEGDILNYDWRDGLPDGNYLGQSAASAPDGSLFFGSTDGVAWIEPATLLAHRNLPPVKFRTRQEDLSTDYRHGPLTVEFCIPDYMEASRAEYSYRIPKLDPRWHDCSNILTFNQPPYGKYTLEVRTRLRNQEWERDISSIQLSVAPPFWLTAWAKALYVLLALGLIAYIVWWEHEKMEKKYERENLVREHQIGEERLQFYTNITHELRTPLTLIIGPLDDLAEEKDLPARAKERISKVNQSAHQLLGLINQLLEFRKTETSNKKLTVVYGNLSAFVEEMFSRFDEISENDKTVFILQAEPDIHLWFDPDTMTSILNNLLSNARKYTPEGQIVLSLKREAGSQVTISVQDTGYGIPEKSISRIFDRYYQAEGPHQASGTGIGLALVKSLCELHRISIKLTSRVGTGTTFILTMDADETYPEAEHAQGGEEAPAAVPQARAQVEEAGEEDDSRPLVLVVEDNRGICEFIRDSLSDQYRVETAGNGKEGLALALKKVPDIIISDIMMPVMDGIALCKAVKSDIVTSHIPVILLTAKSSVESRKEGYDVGADSYIVKPFNKGLLTSRIQNILSSRAQIAGRLAKGENPVEVSSMDNSFLKRFSQQVESSLQDNTADVESIAAALCMSPSTLYRKIKGLTGISPNEFIRNLKLNKAAELLRTTDLTVAEVAFRCGMGSAVYFRNCFKERFGKTPTEYKSNP